jgi:hypothetical protein
VVEEVEGVVVEATPWVLFSDLLNPAVSRN